MSGISSNVGNLIGLCRKNSAPEERRTLSARTVQNKTLHNKSFLNQDFKLWLSGWKPIYITTGRAALQSAETYNLLKSLYDVIYRRCVGSIITHKQHTASQANTVRIISSGLSLHPQSRPQDVSVYSLSDYLLSHILPVPHDGTALRRRLSTDELRTTACCGLVRGVQGPPA